MSLMCAIKGLQGCEFSRRQSQIWRTNQYPPGTGGDQEGDLQRLWYRTKDVAGLCQCQVGSGAVPSRTQHLLVSRIIVNYQLSTLHNYGIQYSTESNKNRILKSIQYLKCYLIECNHSIFSKSNSTTLCLKNYTLFIFAITFLFVNQFS